MINGPEQLEQLTKKIISDKKKNSGLSILVSMGTCGIAAGATSVLVEFQKQIKKQKLTNITLIETGCMGHCHSEPTIEILDHKAGTSNFFGDISEDAVKKILEANGKPILGITTIDRNWYYPEDEKKEDHTLQARIVLRNSGIINPEKIDEYIARDGYKALAKSVSSKQPQEIIDTITESGLRGRGGGGFPTGRKWQFAANQKTDKRYIICNADEGDPGAFMDRAVLEGDPHAVLEAMAIAGFAIGSNEGIIYIRAEYPLAIKRLEIAIAQANEKGFLGDNIFGSDFSFTIRIKYGAGAFVCGEETALISSIEGKRGQPTFKPPFPAIAGLWKKPTIVNNVETLANIPAIIRNGVYWFKAIGTDGCPGTKVFALAGKINKVGLIEVPMGTSLNEIIFNLGKGIKDNKKFKAVQTGGPSGGCITKEFLDTKIDYESLKELGSMMGSGGMIVMDEDDCMVDVAKFFLEFTMDESCGKCTPCRVGGRQMYGILEKITLGNGTIDDLALLEELSEAIKMASLCGLGMTAPNPVLATLHRFKDEYLAHVIDKKCPAGRCNSLVTYEVKPDLCVGCTLCARKCPVSCISGKVKEVHSIDQETCIRCGACFDACKFKAITKK